MTAIRSGTNRRPSPRLHGTPSRGGRPRYLVVSICFASIALFAAVSPAQGQARQRLDPRLVFLHQVHTELGRQSAGDLLRGSGGASAAEAADERMAIGQRATALALRIVSHESFMGSLRFTHAPEARLLARLASLGVRFRRYDGGAGDNGRAAGSHTVFPAEIPWTSLPALAADADIASIAPAWRVALQKPLAVSRPQVQADAAWDLLDGQGRAVTGRGRLIADLDTGVNYFHPALFHADGDTLEWLDVDASGDLTAGDTVDLNGNGLADEGESLRYVEASGAEELGNDPQRFNPGFDWLYNDADESGDREYGAPFGETQPGYGELLFIVPDPNANDRLDPGERLVTLATSKVRAIRGRDGSIAVRGENLLEAELDYYGHGTQVSGIICGGWPGVNRMSGIAPEAELLHGINDYADEPPFLLGLEDHLAWAATYAPDAFLVEDGEWVWEYLDGSSNAEIMLNEYAADQDILAIVPAGNLATGGMHTRFATTSEAGLQIASSATVAWITLLWTEPRSAQVAIEVPGGPAAYLPLNGSTLPVGDYEVYSYLSVSPRGTRRVDLRLEHEVPGTSLDGPYSILCEPAGGAVIDVHGYYYDNHSGWYSASSWEEVHLDYTVTWPATADSAVAVAAYNPDGDGDINSFSGWGPRIDERPNVDIAAPGSTVTSIHPFFWDRYCAFGGTSSAGPHVAGAAALLRQIAPEMDSGLFRTWIRAGAQIDQYTDDPNRWGAGKLRIYDAFESTAGWDGPWVHDRAGGLRLSAGPNPLWGTAAMRATVRYALPGPGPAWLSVLDLQGRVLRSWQVAEGPGPIGSVTWDGRDARGRPVPSGMYLVRLVQGEAATSQRLAVVR